ncbi:MAG TPA: heavy metal-binding domain-containing protein [Verrucomicrobiae bacterium]|nr:heavy metal-binding domain-containing protein [Verrucomicrobiae bacterium]
MNDQPPPLPSSAGPPPRIRPCVMTGLSGNEIFCLRLKGFAPGDLVIGNSVHSLGILGGIGAGFQGLFGGEVTQVTNIINEGRHAAFQRMIAESAQRGAVGLTGVTNELRHLKGNIEFLSVASALHRVDEAAGPLAFSSSANGQELYSLMDSGYQPRKFVFGNVAYSIGVSGGILGGLKSLARGEIREFSDVFNATRHLALQRIVDEARAAGANAVLGIETRVMPFQGVHEMLMLGTAAFHPGLPPQAAAAPVTSDMTCEEMWNMTNLGYAPLKLVLRTAIYSLGVVGGLKAAFQSITRGEITDLTSLIYDAREHAISLLKQEADGLGADDVIGIHVHIHELGSLIEFMAVGTAVKRIPGFTSVSPSLPPQAVIRDKSTWVTGQNIMGEEVTV